MSHINKQQTLQEHERAVVFRFGRQRADQGPEGPGIEIFIVKSDKIVMGWLYSSYLWGQPLGRVHKSDRDVCPHV